MAKAATKTTAKKAARKTTAKAGKVEVAKSISEVPERTEREQHLEDMRVSRAAGLTF